MNEFLDVLTEQTITLIVICVVGFLIARQFLLWYWKVNHMASKLESIEELLQEISSKLPDNTFEPPTDSTDIDNKIDQAS
ncbi:hypothetical protein L1N85_19875 [Paenibacillus alkaliterrae]|uniref:hypothetical protein n=1 Tax=Paenibacillus alkaliterrae TaxID=320909 RepID=UPI001F1917CE|nr:hypothetical protein [Paenibacillus alkaliterrae]MCF2940654.1 hypothetical protein [Paenibacillus alkaliterrae]